MAIRIVGHRGAAGVAPENTLPSFEAAWTAGVAWLFLCLGWLERQRQKGGVLAGGASDRF